MKAQYLFLAALVVVLTMLLAACGDTISQSTTGSGSNSLGDDNDKTETAPIAEPLDVDACVDSGETCPQQIE